MTILFYTNIVDSNHGYIISWLDDIIDRDQLKYLLANFIIVLIPNQFNMYIAEQFNLLKISFIIFLNREKIKKNAK
jgi:hypothetical protein